MSTAPESQPVMHPSLDPILAAALSGFARRRRLLLVLRALSGGAIVLCLLVLPIMAMDRLTNLSDTARLALSAAMYLAAIATLLAAGAWRALRSESVTRLARALEAREPRAAQDLLAAVELSGPVANPSGDSPALRALLRQRVSERLSGINLRSALPWRTINRWLSGATFTLLLIAVLCFVPRLQGGLLLKRALLPWSNLERASDLKITILQPQPIEGFVPQGEPVRVEVELSAQSDQPVSLELSSDSSSSSATLLPMSPVAERRFVADLPIGREPMRYVVRAGLAATKSHRLDPQPRPAVVMFHKTYQSPSYAHQPDRSISETSGDLEALHGSIAKVQIELDQPVRMATLSLVSAGKKIDVTLTPAGTNRVAAELPMLAPGQYQVHLVAQRTAFENRFRPSHPVRVIDDQQPTVTLSLPAVDASLAPDAVVPVRGIAHDDLGITRLWTQLRTNDGKWLDDPASPAAVTNASSAQRSTTVDRRVDLYSQSLRVGDVLWLRLAASDTKGQTAFSAERRVTIATEDDDPQRWEAIRQQRRAAQASAQATEAALAAASRATQAAITVQTPNLDPTARQQAVAAAWAAQKEIEQKSGQAFDAGITALQQSPAPPAEEALVSSSQAVSRARRQLLPEAAAQLDRASSEPDATRSAMSLQEAAAKLNAVASTHRASEIALRATAAASQAQAIADDLRRAEQQQRQALEQLPAQRTAEALTKLSRQEAAITSASRSADAQLDDLARSLPAPIGEAVDRTRKALATARLRVEEAATKGDPAQLPAAAEALRQSLDQAANQMRSLAEQARPDAQAAIEALRNNKADVTKTLAQAGQSTKDEARQPLLKSASEIARDEARIEESRPRPDNARAADADRLSQAVAAIAQAPGKDQSQAATDLAKAWQTIDASRAIERIAKQIQAMDRNTQLPATGQPASRDQVASQQRQWGSTRQQLRRAAEDAQAAGMPPSVKPALEQVADDRQASAVTKQIEKRLTTPPTDTPSNESEFVDNAMKRNERAVQQAAADAKPQLDRASEQVRQAAGPMSSQARELARRVDELQKNTAQAAQSGSDDKAANQPADAAALKPVKQQQQNVAQEVERLRESLRRDAAERDPLTPEGRQAARDADTASALLRDASARAAARVEQALAQPQSRQQALREAGDEQKRLASTLRSLADRMETAEKGQPRVDDPALAKAEAALGLDRAVEKEHERLDRLAELAQTSAEKRREALEKELASDPQMQRELRKIAAEAARRGAAQAQDAAKKQAEIAEQADKQTQTRQAQQKDAGHRVQELAQKARTLAERSTTDAAKTAKGLSEEAGTSAASSAQAAAEAAKDLDAAASEPTSDAVTRAAAPLTKSAEAMEQAERKLAGEVAKARAKAEQSARDVDRAARMQAKTESDRAAAAAKRDAANASGDATRAKAAQTELAAAEAASRDAGENLNELRASAARLSQSAAQAQAAQQQVSQAKAEARQLAEQARNVARQMRTSEEQQAGAMRDLSTKQADASKRVEQAQEALRRASSHEKRLGQEASSKALSEAAARLNETQQGSMRSASAEMESAQNQPGPAAAQRAAKASSEAAKSLSESASAAASQASSQGNPEQGQRADQRADQRPEGQQSEGQSSSESQQRAESAEPSTGGSAQESKALARALDELTRAESSSGTSSENPSSLQSRSQAMAEATAQRAAAHQQARAQGGLPGEAQSTPTNRALASPAAAPEQAQVANDDRWAKLPPELAKQLVEAQRDQVPGDYRAMVDRYFRAIAERSRAGGAP
jgi:hypothetical protein